MAASCRERDGLSSMVEIGESPDLKMVGTLRCGVPARAERAERIVGCARLAIHVAPLFRGADSAARCPYPIRTLPGIVSLSVEFIPS